jgi:hypothetical protein
VTRQDLSNGAQLAQSLHASLEFFNQYPDLSKEWITQSSYLVCLSAKDEQELEALSIKAKERNITVVEFREPDLNNELTALCFEPTIEAKKLCSSIPLAMKEKKEVSHV